MWAIYAIVASILWGVDYALTDRALKNIPFSLLLGLELFFGFLTMIGISIFSGQSLSNWATLFSSSKIRLLVIAIIVAFNAANILIVLSIGDKNATLSGLIEISYPLFIATFSWLFFRENNLNSGTICGGLFVIVGVFVIYFFNQ